MTPSSGVAAGPECARTVPRVASQLQLLGWAVRGQLKSDPKWIPQNTERHHTFIYIYTFASTYIYIHISICLSMYVCLYMYVYVCVYVYIAFTYHVCHMAINDQSHGSKSSDLLAALMFRFI